MLQHLFFANSKEKSVGRYNVSFCIGNMVDYVEMITFWKLCYSQFIVTTAVVKPCLLHGIAQLLFLHMDSN